MCPHSSAPPSRTSNARTSENLTTLALGPSSSPMACSYGYCVPRLLCKMVKLSASSVSQTMSCILCFSSLFTSSLLGREPSHYDILAQPATYQDHQCIMPYFALFGTTLTYEYLCVFGCACYPNMSATTPHKPAPRSVRCVFLEYSYHHRGYHCLDLSTNRLMISRHMVFDEPFFPLPPRPIQL
jgi:hypothetical protein